MNESDLVSDGTFAMLSVALGKTSVAIPVDFVKEVLPMVALIPIPRRLSWIRGLMNLRGSVVPVVDLRGRFTRNPGTPTVHTRILILEQDEFDMGFLVDRVLGFREVSADSLSHLPGRPLGVDARLFNGVYREGDCMQPVLNVRALLTRDEEERLRQVARPQSESI